MADVEFNYTASDKTGPASDSVVKRMSATGKKVEKGIDNSFTRGLIGAVGKASPKAAAMLTDVFASAGGKGGHILAAGIAAASPLIGATVAGAVIGAVGGGGVIGGVALVASDPRVKAAGTRLGQNLMADLRSDAGSFVEPVLRNIDKIGTRFDALRPRIKNIFGNSSRFLDPLVDGVLKGVDGIVAGVDRLISKAGPVMDSFGRGFATLGESAGRSLAIIGDGSEDAAKALDLTFRVIGEVTENVALLIRGLTELYGVLDGIGQPINDTVRGWFGMDDGQKKAAASAAAAADGTDRLSGSLSGLIPSLGSAAVEAGSAATEYDKMRAATDAATNANRGLYASQTDVADGFAKANAAIRDNGRTVDVNSEKGRANRKVLTDQAAAVEANYRAFVAVNGQGPKSAAVASDLRDKFEALGRRAGYSAGEAQRLADRISGLPGRREIKLIMETDAASRRAREIQAQLNRIPRTIGVRVIVSRQGEVTYAGGGGRQASNFDANSSFRAAAHGDGARRAGPPTPVSVNSSVDVYLDGRPFYQVAARAVSDAGARAAWRQKVGYR
jgi:hypothetical protein